MKEDPRIIFRASTEAAKAADFLASFSKPEEKKEKQAGRRKKVPE